MYQVLFRLADGSSESFATLSKVLAPQAYDDPASPYEIEAHPRERYGAPDAKKIVRIGNGGLGPTGVLRVLCEAYLDARSLQDTVRFEWVCNPSRLTQVALQAGKVDLALTYERYNEEAAEEEGWSKSVGILCHDHWVLVGPTADTVELRAVHDPVEALRAIAAHEATFHTRGDGSATMHMEHSLWDRAGIPLNERDRTTWYQRVPGSPLSALRNADAEGAYMFVDRATFLFARTQGWAASTSVWVERKPELLNTCVICVKPDEQRREVLDFVEWLGSDQAQAIITSYGKDKLERLPWLSPGTQEEMSTEDALRRD